MGHAGTRDNQDLAGASASLRIRLGCQGQSSAVQVQGGRTDREDGCSRMLFEGRGCSWRASVAGPAGMFQQAVPLQVQDLLLHATMAC